MDAAPLQLIIVSGLSGSGKSVVMRAFEDMGYYCVDNLPPTMLDELVEHLRGAGHRRLAVSVDVRSRDPLDGLPATVAKFRDGGIDTRIVFLEAKTDTLVKRFSETRRRHPLSIGDQSLTECLESERTRLEPVSSLGHRIDTSDLTPNALRQWINQFVSCDASRLVLLFESFGFKHGIPLDADFTFDVRCLPNPYWDPALRPFTGRDAPVIAFLRGEDSVRSMLGDLRIFLDKWLPAFVRDQRSYLTVAIGCTGGQHRSVFMVERLAEHFRPTHQVLVRHRQLEP